MATSTNIHGATLTRRQFVKTGGALVVGFSLVGQRVFEGAAGAATAKNSLDATLSASWFEIHADNTILIRTGKVDFGQSTAHTAYKQLVAEELNVSYDAITSVVMGDTDRTPDGGFSAGFLEFGGQNIRKAAAYTYQALLDLAATRLGVDKNQLTVKNGVVSGGGKTISYGELVRGQQLKLAIPVAGDLTSMFGLSVTGDPPVKPVSEYTIVGKSFANTVTPGKVRGKEQWVTDVRLPDMLHGRVIHPKTLGSTLIAAGSIDKTKFPNAQVIVKGNLVGVVAPTEWEAIKASQAVAADTKWSDWKGLPGHAQLHTWLREKADWTSTQVSKSEKSRGSVAPALDAAPKTFTASYELPYMKHAPIGPTIAVGDVRPDGTVFVHTHNQNPQALRGQIAMMLGTPVDNVVVRIYAGPGHYGRSNGGNAGAEDEAVILSQAVGKPVRVQWMRPDDLMWSTQSPAGYSNIRIGWDGDGRITAYDAAHYMPAMQDDRLVGAVLAGLPTMPPPGTTPLPIGSTLNTIQDPWVYDRVANVAEAGYGTFQVGQKESPLAIGLRDHSMRTPGQLQQNYPRELAFSEAAARAGIDAIEFRLRNTDDQRLIGVLEAVRDASGWQTRSAPSPRASASGAAKVSGQGVSAMLRSGTYWACVCHVSVVPGTGKVSVDKYTIAVDPGIVVNPLQLKRQIEGGALMGLSHALYEELTFDEGAVTSRDWRSYPILTMADVPEIKVVILSHPEVGMYGGGSEAANALAVSAIAAAFFDATGKPARRLPLKAAYVQSVLNTQAGTALAQTCRSSARCRHERRRRDVRRCHVDACIREPASDVCHLQACAGQRDVSIRPHQVVRRSGDRRAMQLLCVLGVDPHRVHVDEVAAFERLVRRRRLPDHEKIEARVVESFERILAIGARVESEMEPREAIAGARRLGVHAGERAREWALAIRDADLRERREDDPAHARPLHRERRQVSHDARAEDRRQPVVRNHGLECAIGRGEQPPRDRRALGLVGIEQRIVCASRDDERELPRQVVGVLQTGIHALPAHRAVNVGGVTQEEAAAIAKALRASVVDAVGREPAARLE